MAKYPKPMFDFNEMRQFCLDKMKEAYDAHMYGDDSKVMNGEWKKIFDYSDGTTVKDETNEKTSKTKKRARTPDDHEHDDGENADIGDVTEDERPRKKGKADTKKNSKGAQGNLDGIVTRSKKKQ